MVDCGGDVDTIRTKAGLGLKRLAVCCGGKHPLTFEKIEAARCGC